MKVWAGEAIAAASQIPDTIAPPPPSNPNAITALLPNIASIKKGTSTYLFGGYDPSNGLPYTENWSFDLQWQPANSWLLSAGYVGNHGVHQVLAVKGGARGESGMPPTRAELLGLVRAPTGSPRARRSRRPPPGAASMG